MISMTEFNAQGQRMPSQIFTDLEELREELKRTATDDYTETVLTSLQEYGYAKVANGDWMDEYRAE